MSDAEDHQTPNEYDMLRLTPHDVIVFSKSESNGGDMCASVDITCTSKHPITYKIKTTSPDKFRVRPSAGALNPGVTTTISVVLQQGYHLSSACKDKFLVMCSPIPEGLEHSQTVINEIWKNKVMSSPDVQQHRLRCVSSADHHDLRNGSLSHTRSSDMSGDHKAGGGGNLNEMKMSQVTEQVRRLEQEVRFSQNLQWITLLALLIISIAIVYVLRQEIIQYHEVHNQNTNSDVLCSRNSDL